MQKVKVTDIKVEAGTKGDRSWEKVTIIGEDGTQFTTFDTKAKGLKGALIELEPIVKGRYVNFEKWNVLEESPITTPVPGTDPATTMLHIQADFKIAALQVAGRLAAADKIDKDEIKDCTEQIYAWLTSRAKTAEEAWEGMGSEERDPDSIKTLGDLFTACLADFKMPRDDVIRDLGYSNQKDIKESPVESYRIISHLKGNNESPLNNPSREE